MSYERTLELPKRVVIRNNIIRIPRSHVAWNRCCQQALGSQPYRKHRTRLPSYFMYDDHELVNNWDAVDDLVVRVTTCVHACKLVVFAKESI